MFNPSTNKRKVKSIMKTRDNAYQPLRKNRYNSNFSNTNEKKQLERFPRYVVGERVYVPDKNRMGVIDRVEFDPVWGPQLFVLVLPNEGETWGEEHFWFQWDKVKKLERKQFSS